MSIPFPCVNAIGFEWCAGLPAAARPRPAQFFILTDICTRPSWSARHGGHCCQGGRYPTPRIQQRHSPAQTKDNDAGVLAWSLSLGSKLTQFSSSPSEAYILSLAAEAGRGVVGIARGGSADVPKELPRHGRNFQLRASEALFRWRETQRLQLVRRDSVQLKQPLMLTSSPARKLRGFGSAIPPQNPSRWTWQPPHHQIRAKSFFFLFSFRAEAFFHSTAIRSQFNPPQPQSNQRSG